MQLLVLAAAIINAQRPPPIVNQFWDDVVALPVVENGVLYDYKQPVIAGKTVSYNGVGRFGGQCMVLTDGGYYRYPNPFTFSGDFTIEGHTQPSTQGRANNYLFDFGVNGLVLKVVGNQWKLAFGGGATPLVDTTVQPSVGVWYHFAVVRQGALIKLFIDGVMLGQSVFTTVVTATTFTWGGYGGGTGYNWYGKLDCCRISLTARYTANFTPPMSPFIAGGREVDFDPFWDKTVLMTQGGITGGSATDLTARGTITAVLNASVSDTVKRFGTNSLKIPGNASYFRVLNDDGRFDFNSTDFTVEGWVYLTDATGSNHVFGRGNATTFGGYKLMLDNRRPRIFTSTASPTSWSATPAVPGSEVQLNTWTHLAMVRYGNKMGVYVNGVLVIEHAIGALTVSAVPFTIGASVTGTEPTPGYIDSVRVTRAARYTANFTPKMVKELATNGNVVNLADYDTYYNNSVFNAQLTDTLADRRQTVGPTLVGSSVMFDSTRKLFGKNTLTMDTGANGNVAYVVNKALLNADDFTVESWINTTYDSTALSLSIASQWDVSAGGVWALSVRSTPTELGRVRFNYTQSLFIGSTTNIADGQWHHIAVVRRDGVLTLYVDGVAEASRVVATRLSYSGTLTIGKLATSLSTAGFRLNIADLRITNGAARYNANFTKPVDFHPYSSLAA